MIQNILSVELTEFLLFTKELEIHIEKLQNGDLEKLIDDHEKLVVDFMIFVEKNCHHLDGNKKLYLHIYEILYKLYDRGNENIKDFLDPIINPKYYSQILLCQ